MLLNPFLPPDNEVHKKYSNFSISVKKKKVKIKRIKVDHYTIKSLLPKESIMTPFMFVTALEKLGYVSREKHQISRIGDKTRYKVRKVLVANCGIKTKNRAIVVSKEAFNVLMVEVIDYITKELKIERENWNTSNVSQKT